MSEFSIVIVATVIVVSMTLLEKVIRKLLNKTKVGKKANETKQSFKNSFMKGFESSRKNK